MLDIDLNEPTKGTKRFSIKYTKPKPYTKTESEVIKGTSRLFEGHSDRIDKYKNRADKKLPLFD